MLQHPHRIERALIVRDRRTHGKARAHDPDKAAIVKQRQRELQHIIGPELAGRGL